ncbi:hypothetical protein Tco_0312308, partial [Tanacetum coccineum]
MLSDCRKEYSGDEIPTVDWLSGGEPLFYLSKPLLLE